MIIRLILIIVLGIFLSTDRIFGQEYLPLHRDVWQEVERVKTSSRMSVHLAVKPFYRNEVPDSLLRYYGKDTTKYYYDFTRALLRDHTAQIKKEDYRLALDVIYDFGGGRDRSDRGATNEERSIFSNVRGLMASGQLGRRFSFYTGFYEIQRVVPYYQSAFIDSVGVYPGFGRVKDYRQNGYDHSMSFAGMRFNVLENWNIDFVYDKQVIGFGYRSLIWSDASFAFPSLRSEWSFFDGKLKYFSNYGVLQSLERLPRRDVPESLFKRKSITMNYLSWKPHNRVELGVMQATIWQRVDSTRTYNMPWNAYIPLIGLPILTEGWNGRNNCYAGFNLRFEPVDGFTSYFQVLVNDVKSKCQAYQAGIKALNLGLKGLDFQVEWNSIGTEAYSGPNALQSLTHFNQPIGHPSFNTDDELIVLLDYRYKRLFLRNKLVYWTSHDIETKATQYDVEAGYFLNPKTNSQVSFGVISRSVNYQELVYSISFRTNLHNRYFDF